jgi:hypothetical protein
VYVSLLKRARICKGDLGQEETWARICKGDLGQEETWARICKGDLGQEETWARICKRWWSPGIDSKESISPAYVACRASATNRVVIQARHAGNRFLVSEKVYKYGLRRKEGEGGGFRREDRWKEMWRKEEECWEKIREEKKTVRGERGQKGMADEEGIEERGTIHNN